MSEQVQPLTLQKTTNLEEHQQFFTKINEIIDNLAPTVAEAEAATASAEQAIADAETAIGNANTAVSTANAASARAQAAADTVAGFNARLTEVEDTAVRNHSAQVQVIDSDLQVVNGHDLAVAGDVNIASQVIAEGAEIAGMAIEKSGSRTVLSNESGVTVVGQVTAQVPTTTTGQRNLSPANGTRVQNDLDNYAGMVRTTGNQSMSGLKNFISPDGLNAITTSNRNSLRIGSTTAYNRIRSYLSTDAGEDLMYELGTTYVTPTTNFLSLSLNSFKTTQGNPDEMQSSISLNFTVGQDDTGEVYLLFTKQDGTKVRKNVAKFNGSAWEWLA